LAPAVSGGAGTLAATHPLRTGLCFCVDGRV
jgi:hypothetical protein